MPLSHSERARLGAAARNAKLTPEQRSASARRAAEARTSLDAHIDAIVAKAPELKPEQKSRLAVLLVA